MKAPRIAVAMNPFASAMGTLLLAGMLLATISLTRLNLQWTIFLCGILAAAVIASVSNTSNARWVIARRTSQLKAARERLATESRLRAHAEKALAGIRTGVELVDEAMPAMLAYADANGIVRYHNHAYARWVGLQDQAIDGRRVVEILGGAAYAEIEERLGVAMGGREVRYERTQTMRNGEVLRLFVQYIPHFGADGNVAGLFAILTDITRAGDLAPVQSQSETNAAASVVARVVAALEHDEFCLYGQSIATLNPSGEDVSLCEVLLRLKVEEENHLPAGTFLPVAEEHGLMPHLDRWVVRKALDSASAACAGKPGICMLNVAAPTVAEGGFVEFVCEQLAAHGLGGGILGFEFPESDVLANPRPYRDLISRLSGSGCRFAVSGLGRNPVSIDFFKELGVKYLKIDGGIVFNLLRNPDDLAKVKAINQAAHSAGMLTIAECVENEDTRAALERIDTDYVQGFGVSKPRLMGGLDARDASSDAPLDLEEIAA